MKSIAQDLQVLNQLNFEKPPIGVKFSPVNTKMEGIERIKRPLNLCEMIPEAQKGEPFYAKMLYARS